MELDGRIIIGMISVIWITGVSCLLIDSFIKRPSVYIINEKPKPKIDSNSTYLDPNTNTFDNIENILLSNDSSAESTDEEIFDLQVLDSPIKEADSSESTGNFELNDDLIINDDDNKIVDTDKNDDADDPFMISGSIFDDIIFDDDSLS